MRVVSRGLATNGSRVVRRQKRPATLDGFSDDFDHMVVSKACQHVDGSASPYFWSFCEECWNLFLQQPDLFPESQKRRRLQEELSKELEREREREQAIPSRLRWRLQCSEEDERPYWENILTGEWQWERPQQLDAGSDLQREGAQQLVIGGGPQQPALCEDAACAHRNPPGSKWCNACGRRLRQAGAGPSAASQKRRAKKAHARQLALQRTACASAAPQPPAVQPGTACPAPPPLTQPIRPQGSGTPEEVPAAVAAETATPTSSPGVLQEPLWPVRPLLPLPPGRVVPLPGGAGTEPADCVLGGASAGPPDLGSAAAATPADEGEEGVGGTAAAREGRTGDLGGAAGSSAEEGGAVPEETALAPEEPSAARPEDALRIIGFRIGSSLLRTTDVEWAVFRDQIQAKRNSGVKHEIEVVDIQNIYFTQRTCSHTLRNGKPVAELVQDLREKRVHPLEDDFLILDVIQANVRLNRRRGTRRRSVYFTLDHRRLKAMRDAGCDAVRVHVLVSGSRVLDNFLSKAMESLGLRVDILVRGT